MKETHDRLAQEIKDHQENNGLFYNLEDKIKDARTRADQELAALQGQLDDLGPAPSLDLPKAPTMETVAEGLGSPVQNGPDLALIEQERRDATASRDSRLAEIDSTIRGILDGALARGSVHEAGDRSAARIAQLRSERDLKLAEIDEKINDRSARLESDLAALSAATLAAGESVAEQSALRSLINNNTEQAELLRLEAADLYANSNVALVGAWVGHFWPESTNEQREAFVYGPIVMAIAALVAFLPAIILELTIASLLRTFRPTPPAGRPRRGRLLSWRMFKARVVKRSQQHKAAITAKADEAIELAQAQAKEDLRQAKRQAETLVVAAEAKMKSAQEDMARQQVAHHDELRLVETAAAEQCLQMKSDADRDVLEAQANTRVAQAEAKAEIGRANAMVESTKASALEAARTELRATLAELEADAAAARKRAAVAEVDAAATHEAERVKSTIIEGLRKDVESLATQRINFTIQDSSVKSHRIAG